MLVNGSLYTQKQVVSQGKQSWPLGFVGLTVLVGGVKILIP